MPLPPVVTVETLTLTGRVTARGLTFDRLSTGAVLSRADGGGPTVTPVGVVTATRRRAVLTFPAASRAVTVTWNEPEVAYTWATVVPLACAPSPKSQEIVVGPDQESCACAAMSMALPWRALSGMATPERAGPVTSTTVDRMVISGPSSSGAFRWVHTAAMVPSSSTPSRAFALAPDPAASTSSGSEKLLCWPAARCATQAVSSGAMPVSQATVTAPSDATARSVGVTVTSASTTTSSAVTPPANRVWTMSCCSSVPLTP